MGPPSSDSLTLFTVSMARTFFLPSTPLSPSLDFSLQLFSPLTTQHKSGPLSLAYACPLSALSTEPIAVPWLFPNAQVLEGMGPVSFSSCPQV